MARYGIVSDIHGNLDALGSALHFLITEQGVEEILCLGDIVGYNAEPDACIELLDQVGAVSVAGNHDLIAVGALGFERCAVRPAFALERTREVLSEGSRRALSSLPLTEMLEGDVLLIHGGVADVCEYMTNAGRVASNDATMHRTFPMARVCFFGHTHDQKLWEVHGGVAEERSTAATMDVGVPGRTYFVNPGSVDAARKDGERMAECAIFDSALRTVSFHHVLYDHDRSERRAELHGYRMTPAQEKVRKTLRAFDQKKRGAMRRLRAWLSQTEPAATA